MEAERRRPDREVTFSAVLPAPWVGVVLALAVYRIVRLVGWDDFPLVAKARNWATGAEDWDGEIYFRRELFAHFLGCAFCQGFWWSVIFYVAWLELPTATLYVAAPFALSGAVGLIAKNLDA